MLLGTVSLVYICNSITDICKRITDMCEHHLKCIDLIVLQISLKGIYPEFQVIRGFSQKIPADFVVLR